jgi:hypothetical protein
VRERTACSSARLCWWPRSDAASARARCPALLDPGEPVEAAPGLRLPRTFVPTAYAARLAIVPAEPQFTGHLEIDVLLPSPSRVIWLDAQGLTFGARYQRFVRTVFGARARGLGWASRPGDTEDTRLLRASLVGFVADAGQDPALLAGATQLAWAWLDDRTAAPSDVADSALAVAARRAPR